MHRKVFMIVILIVFLFPLTVFAHQPRGESGNQIVVTDPEVSKAYYSKLEGKPHVYSITADKPFELYVNILVPDIEGQQKNISAVIVKDGNVNNPLATLDGLQFGWKKFFEEFGNDTYWMGPEYKANVEAGHYEISVYSSSFTEKYVLAIGQIESFNLNESVNALTLIPQIKSKFFNESPANFIFSPFGWGLVLIMYILSFGFGFLYRLILRRLAKSSVRKVHRNIGMLDRIVRIALGIGLFMWAITTSWSPILLFFSGFAIFEAIFSWCGLYAALGKSTCPIN